MLQVHAISINLQKFNKQKRTKTKTNTKALTFSCCLWQGSYCSLYRHFCDWENNTLLSFIRTIENFCFVGICSERKKKKANCISFTEVSFKRRMYLLILLVMTSDQNNHHVIRRCWFKINLFQVRNAMIQNDKFGLLSTLTC